MNSAAERKGSNDIIVLGYSNQNVRYLYAYKGGSLYQPVYLGLRNDMNESDCTAMQLKYKAARAAARNDAVN